MTDPYQHQPREVAIETFALCNAACTFCPYPTLERQGTQLDSKLINELIYQMRSWTEPFFVSPFKVNEPLLDRRLEGICRAIVEECPKATLRLFTNGQPLTARVMDWIAALAAGRVEHLWVSLNSTDPVEYAALMKCTYSIVYENLHRLHARVARGEFPHPVVVSRVLQGNPTGSTLNDRVASDRDVGFHRSVAAHWPRFQSVLIKRDAWLGHVAPSDARVPNRPCERWTELSITAEGKVVQCCMDGKGEYVYGDVREESLLDIYNSPGYQQFRNTISRKSAGAPCDQCSY